VRFNPRKADRPVYTAPTPDMYKLLLVSGSALEDEFLDQDIDKDVRKMLLDAVKKGSQTFFYLSGVLWYASLFFIDYRVAGRIENIAWKHRSCSQRHGSTSSWLTAAAVSADSEKPASTLRSRGKDGCVT